VPLEIRWSRSAERDLIDIWRYTADHWNAAQADRYLDEIEAAVDRLRDFPDSGIDSSHVRRGYRRLPVGSHRLYYRVSGAAVEIVRVLHARMDAESILEE
jgi:toxin ParE1/3/4